MAHDFAQETQSDLLKKKVSYLLLHTVEFFSEPEFFEVLHQEFVFPALSQGSFMAILVNYKKHNNDS